MIHNLPAAHDVNPNNGVTTDIIRRTFALYQANATEGDMYAEVFAPEHLTGYEMNMAYFAAVTMEVINARFPYARDR
jgi:hypothetical protein